ncbi:MAG: nitrite/sulfite reductase, partial [Butyricicoccus sp.]|nr:nitrite/sulfite reductase [Butyricicoccus sp.]
VLDATADGAVTPFGCSVSCIGGAICATGIRDSQGLLMSMLEAVEAADLPADALPTVHVSGCPSSCGTHQIGMLGFVGAAKLIDGKPQPAFNLLLRGNDKQGAEKFGEVIGAMLIESVPQFIVALGQTVAASGLDFDRWLNENEDAFRALAAQYI